MAEISRGWEPCGRGVCAAAEGHEGTCAEASGWEDPTPAEVLPNRAPYDKCSAHLYVEAGKEQEVERG